MYNIEPTVTGRRTTADDRVRAALGMLADQTGPEISIFGWELAEQAGTSRETASRIVARLKRDGVLTGRLGRIVVLDREALR